MERKTEILCGSNLADKQKGCVPSLKCQGQDKTEARVNGRCQKHIHSRRQ